MRALLRPAVAVTSRLPVTGKLVALVVNPDKKIAHEALPRLKKWFKARKIKTVGKNQLAKAEHKAQKQVKLIHRKSQEPGCWCELFCAPAYTHT